MKRTLIRVTLAVVGCLVWALPPAHGFTSFDHQAGGHHRHLIHRAHKDHWKIGYRYSSVNCPTEKRIKNIRLEEAITDALQTFCDRFGIYRRKNRLSMISGTN